MLVAYNYSLINQIQEEFRNSCVSYANLIVIPIRVEFFITTNVPATVVFPNVSTMNFFTPLTVWVFQQCLQKKRRWSCICDFKDFHTQMAIHYIFGMKKIIYLNPSGLFVVLYPFGVILALSFRDSKGNKNMFKGAVIMNYDVNVFLSTKWNYPSVFLSKPKFV